MKTSRIFPAVLVGLLLIGGIPIAIRLVNAGVRLFFAIGPELDGNSAEAFLLREISPGASLEGVQGQHARQDPRDANPIWGLYKLSRDRFAALKEQVSAHYTVGTPRTDLVLSDADRNPQGEPLWPTFRRDVPSWWKLPSKSQYDMFSVKSPSGFEAYFIYVPESGMLHFLRIN